MTDRIEAIRARWEAATPGPWEIDEEAPWSIGWPETDDQSGGVVADLPTWGPDHDVVNPADAEAIANAPEDIAYLLDAYRHMVESWQTLEEMADDIGPLNHGVGCQSHFGKPCDCAWAEFRKVLAPVAPGAEPGGAPC